MPNCDGDHLALLNQVESLVKSHHAFCLLGNHEFNAIGRATKNDESNWACPHTENFCVLVLVFLGLINLVSLFVKFSASIMEVKYYDD